MVLIVYFKLKIINKAEYLFLYRVSFFLSFLLSEHILCKERIAIVKKFDFEILTHLYVLRSLIRLDVAAGERKGTFFIFWRNGNSRKKGTSLELGWMEAGKYEH